MKRILLAFGVLCAACFIAGCGEEDPLKGTPTAPAAGAGTTGGPANAGQKSGGMPPPSTAPGADG